MTTRILTDGTSSFRIRRSLVTTNGIGTDVDATVRRHLDELNKLLGKPIFRDTSAGAEAVIRQRRYATADDAEKAADAAGGDRAAFERFFDLPLTAKHIPATKHATSWDDGSLVDYLAQLDRKEGLTLSDHIDK